MAKEPYFAKREDGWTFQCPHEGEQSVLVVSVEQGEIVLCEECSRDVAIQFVNSAGWNNVSLGEKTQ